MSGPKILFLDIETSPNICTSWSVGYKISLSPDNIVEERRIICISYKFAGDKKVKTLAWDRNQCDKTLLQKFSAIMHSADVLVGHNGDRYDLRFINGRLLYHGLDPVTEVQSIDTLKEARRHFYLNSNKLDYIGQFLKVGKKIQTGGFSLWKQVHLDNNRTALKKMIKYCEQDVLLLEKVFYALRPYVTAKVHAGLLMGAGAEGCPACGSHKVQRWGVRTTKAGRYQRFKCNSCAHTFKSSKKLKD